jgi:hypothetical protein
MPVPIVDFANVLAEAAGAQAMLPREFLDRRVIFRARHGERLANGAEEGSPGVHARRSRLTRGT